MLSHGGVQLQAVSVEPFVSLDGQGAPSYSTAYTVDAQVMEYDTASTVVGGRQFRPNPGGADVIIPLTLYVPGDTEAVPSEQDRITYEGRTFIVHEKRVVKALSGAIHHTRLRCRSEQ